MISPPHFVSRKTLLVSVVASFSCSLVSGSILAQADSQTADPTETPLKAGPKFGPQPDPSRIPLSLPLTKNSGDSNSLDLLPSFPPVSQDPVREPKAASKGSRLSPDLLDFVLRKRENPLLVPDGPNPTEDAAVALDKRHRYQVARTQAQNDPEVREALLKAQHARTDRELREAMRTHYALLFSVMRKFDSSLESLIKDREASALAPLSEPARSTASRK